jgi:glc operon protein GlcG
MNLQLAQSYLDHALMLAAGRGKKIAVALVDDHGELVTYVQKDDCPFPAGVVAQNKAHSAARPAEHRQLPAWAKATGKNMGYWTDPKLTGIPGGLPIEAAGRMMGAIGISGLSETENGELAELAIT